VFGLLMHWICGREYSVTEERELPLHVIGVMLRGNTSSILDNSCS
jgi:hypothetical protein